MRNLLEEGDTSCTGNAMPAGVGLKATLRAAALAAGWKEMDGHWKRPARPAAGARRQAPRRGRGLRHQERRLQLRLRRPEHLRVDAAAGCQGRHHQRAAQDRRHRRGHGRAHGPAARSPPRPWASPTRRCASPWWTPRSVPDAGSCSASRHTYIIGQRRAARLPGRPGEAQGDAGRPASWRSRSAPRSPSTAASSAPPAPYDPETGACEPHIAYGYGCQIAEVEVDMETGQVVVQRLIAAHDVGDGREPGDGGGADRGRGAHGHGLCPHRGLHPGGGRAQDPAL